MNPLPVLQWGLKVGLFPGQTTPQAQFRKLQEEVAELDFALQHKSRDEQIEELGDVFFTACMIAYAMGIDPGMALYRAIEKVQKRKGRIDNGLFLKEP